MQLFWSIIYLAQVVRVNNGNDGILIWVVYIASVIGMVYYAFIKE